MRKVQSAAAMNNHKGSTRSDTTPPHVWDTSQGSRQHRSSAQVTPFGPLASQTSVISRHMNHDVPVKTTRRHSWAATVHGALTMTFRDAFGVLGPPMVLVALLCIGWSSWLIILSLVPNEAVNFIMNTGDYDNGRFWLIPDETSTLQVFTVAAFALLDCLYLYVLLKILVWRTSTGPIERWLGKLWESSKMMIRRGRGESPQEIPCREVYTLRGRFCVFCQELTSIRGKNRKFWNLCLKGLDLTMLCIMLREMLDAGSPKELTYGFVAFVALNSSSCAAEILSEHHSALAEIIIDSMFDLIAAVVFPILVLEYCYNAFEYDRAVFLISMELLPPGSFERRARMYADPTQVTLVRAAFDSLRIRTKLNFFLRIGMNLSFCYRFKRIVDVLIELRVQQQKVNEEARLSGRFDPPTRTKNVSSFTEMAQAQRAVPKVLAIPFVGFSAVILVLSHLSISSSQEVCAPHPQCVVFAYQWQNNGHCPCRALVDGDKAPRTFEQWTHPIDATSTVKALATAGTLETIQLVNRQLVAWPEELRNCRDLTYIALFNTATEEVPAWASELRKLQYFQIEGKEGQPNLGGLPPGLFSDMPELNYLQFGVQHRLTSLPSLDGAPNLRSITLARLYSLTELPSLSRLTHLERLDLSVLTNLVRIPDMASATELIFFTLFKAAQLCCNGFRGECNLSDPFCAAKPNSPDPPVTCLENDALKATPATLRIFEKFSSAVCQPSSSVSQQLTAEMIMTCEGIPFRQCYLPGVEPDTWVEGICYNHRMQVLACNPDQNKIRVRRRQIQDGVGAPCDPIVEAWLGCGKQDRSEP